MTRDNSKLAFSSGFRYQRLLMEGTVEVATWEGVGEVEHNLGYTPFMRFSWEPGDVAGVWPVQDGAGSRAVTGSDRFVTLLFNDSFVLITVTNYINLSDTTVVPIHYRIYAEPTE